MIIRLMSLVNGFFNFIFRGDNMDFPARIIELKFSKKLMQKDIAAAIGITPRNYLRYEKGEQQPTLPVIIRLADYFDVSLDYLVGRSDEPTVHKSAS